MDNKIAAITLILALVATGFTVHQFSENDPDANYLCEEDMVLKYCDHLSGTKITCYPQSDSRKGSKLCGEGWKSLDMYGLPVVAEEKQLVSPGVSGPDKECCPVGAPCYAMVGNRC